MTSKLALHKDSPESPYAILHPAGRWFPADEALRDSSSEKRMPPLVQKLRRRAAEWRDNGHVRGEHEQEPPHPSGDTQNLPLGDA